MRAHVMRSFFFGTTRRLYGALHEPTATAKNTGVLLCYPGVQEYNMTHWAFRKLAGLLNREGFPVMRFDYSCSGDSQGEVYDASLAAQVEDIASAADELKDACGVRRVVIIGMRLGAYLATRAVAEGVKVSDLLLWEPLLRGADYITELERLDASAATLRHQRITSPRVELAGYPFPSTFRAQLDAIELGAVVPKGASRVALFLKSPSPEATDVQRRWEAAGLKVAAHVVHEAGGGVTEGAGAGDAAVLYTQMLSAMVTELTAAKAVGA